MDGFITDYQFVYERRGNYFKGSREEISTYLINHFCSSNGTILDASNDLEGEIIKFIILCDSMYLILLRNSIIGSSAVRAQCDNDHEK